jgi:hypothetical protein
VSDKISIEVLSPEQPEPAGPLLPENDGYLLDSERVGNFEWWYFDCIDTRNDCMLKIVVHLGTDPLRRRFFPTLAISMKTPETTRAIEQRYGLEDFRAEKNRCDVRLRKDCHIYADRDLPGNYHLDINIAGFHAALIFKQPEPFWVPPVHRIRASKGRRHSEFFWSVPQPGSIVEGSFKCNNTGYALSNAIGYHDHNYWQLNSKQGLFIEEVITRWCWGKCVAGPYTVIFSKTLMGGVEVKSIMVSNGEKTEYGIGENLTITTSREIMHVPLRSTYPLRISIQFQSEDLPLELVLNCKGLVESKDLLKGVNPFIARLIKRLVAKPAYYGINATALLETPDQRFTGFGNYELMLFRNR